MERVKLFIIFACFFICDQVGANPLKLSGLVEYALKHSPDFKISLNRLKAGEIKMRDAFFNFFPTLDIKAVQGHDGDESSELSLSLSSRLYDNGLRFIQYRQSQLEWERSSLEREKSREQLCLELSKRYFEHSLAFKISKIQNFQYKLLERQFRSVESQYKQGLKTRLDYIRFKARLQRAKLGVQQAGIVRERGIEEIKKMIGWSAGKLEVDVLEAVDLDMKKIPQAIPGLEKHHEYKIAELSRKINEHTVRRARKKYLPELFLVADASYVNQDYLSGMGSFGDRGKTNLSASLMVSFNLWDWGKRRRGVVLANLEKMNRDNTLDSHLLSLKSTINKLMLDMKQRRKSFFLNKELVEMEKNNYTSLEKSYRRGMTTFLDLINALNDYTGSQESWIRDFFQLKNLMAEFYFHQGKLYETIKNNY